MVAPLPAAFRWLPNTTPLPRMIEEALKLYGTVEKAGPANNPTIMAWADEAGQDIERVYTADSIPWCGLFMLVVAMRSGKIPPGNPLWARSWAQFGRELNPKEAPSLGDVAVFGRAGGGGHVALIVGEGRDSSKREVLWCLGGNQNDRVGIDPIERSRLIKVRRPIYVTQPSTVKPYRITASGKLSTNEA